MGPGGEEKSSPHFKTMGPGGEEKSSPHFKVMMNMNYASPELNFRLFLLLSFN